MIPNPPVPFNDPKYVTAIQVIGQILVDGQKQPGAPGLSDVELLGHYRVAAQDNFNLYAASQANLVAVAEGKATVTLDGNGSPVVALK